MRKLFFAVLPAVSCCLPAMTQVYVQSGADIRIQSGVELVVQGDISLEAGSVLINAGTILLGNSAGYNANFTDQTITPYQYGTGRIVFNSSMPQTIQTLNVFGSLEMSGYDLQFASSVSALKWYLNQGRIRTLTHSAVVTGMDELAIEASPSNVNYSQCWINGSIRRFINPALTNKYTFPLGLSSGVYLAEMDNLMANPLNNISYIDASFQPKLGTDAGLVVTEAGASYTGIHNAGIWHLSPNGTPTTGQYDLRVYINGFTGLSDNLFTILRRPEASSNGADWSVPTGSHVNATGGLGRLVAHGYAQRNKLSTFSEFGIGLLATTLPVNLTQFNLKRHTATQVLVGWQTQTEHNNQGFHIERRLDTETDFTNKGSVASKAANGNSVMPIDYSFTDNNNYPGIAYYRLKQVDLDDRAYYSMIKAIKGGAGVNVLIWPNPSEGQFSIRLEGINDPKEALITDLSGKLVQKFSIRGTQAVNIHNLPAGTYVLTIPHAFGMGQAFKEKVMVVR